MSEENKDQLIYQDLNHMRIFGIFIVLASGIFFLFDKKLPMFALAGWAFVIYGLFATFFSSNLTVTADRSTRTLHLQYRYWLFQRTRKILFDEIADVQAQKSREETGNGHPATVYRLVVLLKDGTRIPFRNYSTQDAELKQWAYRLRLFITGKRQSKEP